MKILITGIHGFVGSNLAEYLISENEIYGLDIVAPEKDGVIKTFSWEDLESGVVPAMDAIIHLAGKAHDTKNKSAAEVYFKVNTGLTQKIFDYFLASGASKFVFFSTAKAAADRVEGVLTEDVVPTPVGPYGESKIKAEEYVLGKELPTGKQVYIFRPCMIHGPGNKGNLNLLYSVVRKGIPWPLGAFENRRTFTSIENICFAVNGVLTSNVKSGIYNMGDDEALSTNELIDEICKSLGMRARIWRLPKGLMTSIAKVGGWLHLPLNPERLQKLTENYVSSNEKIKNALGVERMPVDAREGLQRTLESFK
jgi:nucleoside-diphosphate-sugar epimerase